MKGLEQVVFLAVREALNAPAHPDSKRQDRRKQRDSQRYGARVLKSQGFYSCPIMSKRAKRAHEKLIWIKYKLERRAWAREVAERLCPWDESQRRVA